MRITGKEIFTEESQGSVALQTSATTRVNIGSDGSITLGGSGDKLAVFGGTPVAVQATTATTGTFTAGTGTAAVSGSSWVGNTGTKSYSVSDIVSALKAYGILSA